jgi:hypothetical protein
MAVGYAPWINAFSPDHGTFFTGLRPTAVKLFTCIPTNIYLDEIKQKKEHLTGQTKTLIGLLISLT